MSGRRLCNSSLSIKVTFPGGAGSVIACSLDMLLMWAYRCLILTVQRGGGGGESSFSLSESCQCCCGNTWPRLNKETKYCCFESCRVSILCFFFWSVNSTESYILYKIFGRDSIYIILNTHHRAKYPFLPHLQNCQRKMSKAASPHLPPQKAQGSSRVLLTNSGITWKKLKEADSGHLLKKKNYPI